MHVAGHGGHVDTADAAATNGSETSPTGSIDKEKALLANDSSSSFDNAFLDSSEQNPMMAQLMGVATLEFGVCFHVCLSVPIPLQISSKDVLIVASSFVVRHHRFDFGCYRRFRIQRSFHRSHLPSFVPFPYQTFPLPCSSLTLPSVCRGQKCSKVSVSVLD